MSTAPRLCSDHRSGKSVGSGEQWSHTARGMAYSCALKIHHAGLPKNSAWAARRAGGEIWDTPLSCWQLETFLNKQHLRKGMKGQTSREGNQWLQLSALFWLSVGLFFLFFFCHTGLELRAYSLSHSTKPLFFYGRFFFEIGSWELFPQTGFKLWSSWIARIIDVTTGTQQGTYLLKY
jgi:hypothetical protein